MGSQGVYKLQGKDLKVYKSSLKLSPTQRSILIGSLLGDGTLRTGLRAKEANFKVDQGIRQKDYTFWKYNYFKEWVLTPPKISYRVSPVIGKYEKSWWFRTIRHQEITAFYRLFYRNGKKVIPVDIATFLDSLSLAIWIMDDGSFSRGIYDISTYSFTETEIAMLQKALNMKFGLQAKFYKDRDKGYRLYFSKKQNELIASLIKPFIIPCMRYKLPPLTP